MPRVAAIKPDPRGVLHRALRAATRSDHAMLDRTMLRLDLAVREDYGLFLHIHYSALEMLEAYWREEDRKDFAAMMRAVRSDLQILGVGTQTRPIAHSPLHSSGRMGIAYVIRGSRIGASFLRRRVPSALPTAYLDFKPALAWPVFLEQLEPAQGMPNPVTSEESTRGAQITFELFTALLTRVLA